MNEMSAPVAKPVLRGEIALAILVVINSLGVNLILQSGFGVAATSLFPLVLSRILPFSLGTCTYLFQSALVLALLALRRKIVLSYLISFAVGTAFGIMVDVHLIWVSNLPQGILWRLIWFAASFAIFTLGISLANHCKLPIIPTDLFPRELCSLRGWSYRKVKTTFDLGCLAFSVLLSALFVGSFDGLGIGTVLCALLLGRSVGKMTRWLDKRFYFVSFLSSRQESAITEQFPDPQPDREQKDG